MTTPEPLDERPAGPLETRGGDHLADITVPDFAKGGTVHASARDMLDYLDALDEAPE
jgi:hypothetical protein